MPGSVANGRRRVTDAGESACRRLQPLCSGDQVRIIAPSGAFDPAQLQAGLDCLRRAGLEPVYDEGLFARQRYLAGSDERRRDELLAALDDPRARALWLARGGYGATRLLPEISPHRVGEAAKWLIGFSDATALHGAWARAGVASLHGPNITTIGGWGGEARRTLWSLLMEGAGQQLSGRVVRPGEARGPVLGGNLTVLAAMAGTGYLPSFAQSIVFLEDVGERPYRLDRALTQLLHTGVFAEAAAFVIGQLTDCGDGCEALDVLCEGLSALGVPIIADVPIGHEPSSYPILLGAQASLGCEGAAGTLSIAPQSPKG